MIIYRIGHAGLIVESERTRCLMDPVLSDPFESSTNVFCPKISVDPAGLRGFYDFVVISHEHMDHFCLGSLDRLDRDCPIYFPDGCELITFALRRMGFRRLNPKHAGERISVGALSVVFTPSNVNFPELGALFLGGGRSFWNCVDTVLTEGAVSLVKHHAGRLDVMFAHHQPLVETELGVDSLGSPFPYKRYQSNLQAVIDAQPRFVAPASCGYRYQDEPWRNSRGFPISDAEFVADIRAIAPEIQAAYVPHGGSLAVGEELTITADALPFVKRAGDGGAELVAWRPDRGVPPLVDHNPFGYDEEALPRELFAYLDGEFLKEMAQAPLRTWRGRMAREQLVWHLELAFPRGQVTARFFDFGNLSQPWQASPPRSPKMITAMAASTLLGLRKGDVSAYRGGLSRRVVLRMYAPTRCGIVQFGGIADEPIARVLLPSADRRYVERRLRQMGYA